MGGSETVQKYAEIIKGWSLTYLPTIYSKKLFSALKFSKTQDHTSRPPGAAGLAQTGVTPSYNGQAHHMFSQFLNLRIYV